MRKEFWDQKYQQESFIYGEAPNAFFKTQLDLLPKGKLLLPADGEGRNGVYAAKSGWEVDAFDFSKKGMKKALALAFKNQTTINYQLSSIEDFPFPTQTYDAIGLFFVHLPLPLRKFLHQKVVEALKPGGRLILQGFNKQQLPLTTGGPKNEAMLFDTKTLEEDFMPLKIVHLEEKIDILREGAHHNGEAQVIEFIAHKL